MTLVISTVRDKNGEIYHVTRVYTNTCTTIIRVMSFPSTKRYLSALFCHSSGCNRRVRGILRGVFAV